jgi:hypothetical protein
MHTRYWSSHAEQASPLQGCLQPIQAFPHAPAQLAPGASTRGMLAAGLEPAKREGSPFGAIAFAPPAATMPAERARTSLLALASEAALAGVIVCGGGT